MSNGGICVQVNEGEKKEEVETSVPFRSLLFTKNGKLKKYEAPRKSCTYPGKERKFSSYIISAVLPSGIVRDDGMCTHSVGSPPDCCFPGLFYVVVQN